MHAVIRSAESRSQAMSKHVEELLAKQNELLSDRAALRMVMPFTSFDGCRTNCRQAQNGQ